MNAILREHCHKLKDTVKQHAESSPPLLSEGAFEMQFHVGSTMEHDQVGGCVEHVVSEQAMRFQSPQKLLAFMARVLVSLGAQSPQREGGGEHESE